MKFSVLLSTISKQLSEIASIAGSSTNKDDITQNILIKVADSILVLNLQITILSFRLRSL